jgi:hypothetical protein
MLEVMENRLLVHRKTKVNCEPILHIMGHLVVTSDDIVRIHSSAQGFSPENRSNFSICEGFVILLTGRRMLRGNNGVERAGKLQKFFRSWKPASCQTN